MDLTRAFRTVSCCLLGLLVALSRGDRAHAGVSWHEARGEGFVLFSSAGDSLREPFYTKLVTEGRASVQSFFSEPFDTTFDVYVFPSRTSLDEHWRTSWGMPDFRSECWMVASGVATRLDLLSPARWDTEACEHRSADTADVHRIVTHELVHVYHGQRNVSPDFSNIAGIDWFVEGLASYAAGQHDSSRVASVRKAVTNGTVPASLDRFWTGSLRYALSASVVAFIDAKYGRARLRQLLVLNSLDQLLRDLGIAEAELLTEWKAYVHQGTTW
jgi:hypothetical protein